MSGILVKNRYIIRNLRKSFLYLSPGYSSVRLTKPRLNLIARHQRCFANLAFKHTENGNYAENSESSSHKDTAPSNIDIAILNLDSAAKRNGRTNLFLIENALSLAVQKGDGLTNVQSLYLLRSCGLMLRELPETRVKQAEKIWSQLQKQGCSYDIRHYNSLLKIYVDCDHQFTPSEFLMRLESNNVEPNRVTFLYLMEKYCNDGDLNGASEILEYMREKGFTVNENVFSTLITGHMRINDVSGAMEIFGVMRSSNLTPTSRSYLALVCGHARNRNIEGVKSAIQEAEKNGIQILKEDYLTILSSISSDDHLAYVDEVINLLGNDIISFRQAVLNTAFTLINKGACESAYRLILSICKGVEDSRLNSNVFLNHIVKTNQPMENILNYLKDISEKNLNHLAWLNCAKCCIDYKRFDDAFVVFGEMIKRGMPVRHHHVMPIFSELNSEEDVFLVLKRMYDLGMPADFITFSHGVFPKIDVSDPENVFRKVEETGQSRTSALDALFMYYTHNGLSSNAMYLTKKYPVNIYPDLKLKKFFASHSESEKRDMFSPFHEVLLFIMKNAGRNLRLANEVEGKNLADLISLSPSAFLFFARRAQEEYFQIRKGSIAMCRRILSQKNPKLLVHLDKLENDSFGQQSRTARSKPIEEEERELRTLEERGLSHEHHMYMQQLLQQHVRNKNFDRVNFLKSELEKSNLELSPVTLFSLFHCFKEQANIEEAGKYLKTLNEKYPDFEVETSQVIEFANLLVKFSKFDDVFDVIKSNCKVVRINGSKDFLYRATRKFFDCTIESGNIDFLRKAQAQLLTVFSDQGLAKVMFEPLVKMHLFRNNLEDAVKEFKSIVLDKKIAPYGIQLMKKCITSEDHQMLESVIETASTLEGKIPVLQELALAFLELGRKDQATQVLENLGRKVQPSFLLNTYSRLYGDKSISKLEDFLSVLKRVDGVELSKGYSFLFKLYDFHGDAQRALSMYNEVKHIGLEDSTKRLLNNLFTRMNVAVPSELQGPFTSSKEEIKVNEDAEEIGKSTDPIIGEFQEILYKGVAASALEKLESMKKGHIRSLPLSDMTKLVDLAVENKLGEDLSRNVQAMSYLIENANEIMHPVLAKYSGAGDVESLLHVSNFLPDFSLKATSFNGYLSRAYIVSGKPAELLKQMENRFNKKNKVFSATSFIELLNYPDLKDRAINLAKQYYEVKFIAPMAVVWAHYLLNENYETADKIEKDFKIEGDKADSIILRSLRRTENTTLARKYIDNISKYNCRMRQKERAYGTLLDILVLKEWYDEAVNLVVESKQKGIVLDKHFRSTLVTLKAALERENKPVPFSISSEESIISA